jgi:hypothetical protein
MNVKDLIEAATLRLPPALPETLSYYRVCITDALILPIPRRDLIKDPLKDYILVNESIIEFVKTRKIGRYHWEFNKIIKLSPNIK